MLSEVQIFPIKFKDGLCAFISAVINNQFYISSIALYTSPSSPDGFRLVYPSKILNGKQISIMHPISKEAGHVIQKQIVEKYIRLMENLTKGDTKNEQRQSSA